MTEHVRHPWQRPRGGARDAIGKPDQGNAQVFSIQCAAAACSGGTFGARTASPQAGVCGTGQLVALRCAPTGQRRGPAGAHLLQLPEGADQARAETEYDEQQQEGLVDGGDVHHGDNKATAMPCVPATAGAFRRQWVVNGGGASGAMSKAPRWNSSPSNGSASPGCASSVKAAFG